MQFRVRRASDFVPAVISVFTRLGSNPLLGSKRILVGVL